jgi:hypothetical protein
MSEDQKPLIPSLRPPRKRRPTIVNGWTPPPAPELRAVLTRFATPEEREAVIAAYFNQARGDPESYPVQMALVQRALFLALDAAPEEIGARLDATLDKLAELLGRQQAEVKTHTEAVKQHAELVSQQLEAIKAFVREELCQHREVTDRQIADLRQQTARNGAAASNTIWTLIPV